MVGVNESQMVMPTGGNENDLLGGVVLYYIACSRVLDNNQS